ncbi:MAG: prepilin-type N-terminal cleavage/methylation domain-containing protein [Chloroflexi bacterium]|nr:prepilin-type N-terminal cleavage/methylation domain-containing protein [Chloroflexota bacterium]
MRFRRRFARFREAEVKGILENIGAKRLLSGQKGFGLIEVLIAVAILSIAATAFLGAISTSAIAINKQDRKITSEALAVSQINHTKSQAYQIAPASYPIIPSVPSNYAVTSNATAIVGKDGNIQLITVTVSRGGNTIYTLEDYKVNR